MRNTVLPCDQKSDNSFGNHTYQLSVTPGNPVSEYRAGWIFEYGRRRAFSSIMSAAYETS